LKKEIPMFCPECGVKDTQVNQYCRACGVDLRPVRLAVSKPDEITASAASAREAIGKAFADKIRDAKSPGALVGIAENVLPEVQRFLESPEEKRLRRMRRGTIISSVGLGVAIAVIIFSIVHPGGSFLLGSLGILTFFIGLGFIINGYFLSVPKSAMRGAAGDPESADHPELQMPETLRVPGMIGSVTENTTRDLRVNVRDE
jgi:hypothetical protein